MVMMHTQPANVLKARSIRAPSDDARLDAASATQAHLMWNATLTVRHIVLGLWELGLIYAGIQAKFPSVQKTSYSYKSKGQK